MQKLIFSVIMGLVISSQAQSTYSTLQNTITVAATNFPVKANELLRVVAMTWRGEVTSDKIELRARYPGLPGPWTLRTGDFVLGPATVTLQSFFPSQWRGGEEPASLVIVEVNPVNASVENPQRVVILPGGLVGRLTLQTSTNLVGWSDIQVFTLTNSIPHRFYRLGLILTPPP